MVLVGVLLGIFQKMLPGLSLLLTVSVIIIPSIATLFFLQINTYLFELLLGEKKERSPFILYFIIYC